MVGLRSRVCAGKGDNGEYVKAADRQHDNCTWDKCTCDCHMHDEKYIVDDGEYVFT